MWRRAKYLIIWHNPLGVGHETGKGDVFLFIVKHPGLSRPCYQAVASHHVTHKHLREK